MIFVSRKMFHALVVALIFLFVCHPCYAERTTTDIFPHRVVQNITSSPDTSRAVTWRTRTPGIAQAAQIVPLSALPDAGNTVTTVSAQTTRMKLDDTLFVYHHWVVFDSLSQDAEYAYRVGEDALWSEWNRFRTATEKPDPFTFVYFGDIQEQVFGMGSLMFRTAVMAAPEAKFWLFIGDMVDNGPEDREWEVFFDAVSWMPKIVPLVLVPGNHEYPDPRITPPDERRITRWWRPHFTLPENGPPGLAETAYHFEFQGVCFIVLNGNEKIEQQAAWMEAILEKNSLSWIIVAVHQPVYAISRRRNITRFQEVLAPVFDRFSVDLVLQGHDHGYARTLALKNHAPVNGTQKGTVYVISNSGPKFYPASDRYGHLMARTLSEEMLFHTIQVDEKSLSFTAFNLERRAVDTFSIQKRVP
jgi:acid phosphatase type 7